jgi:hypothetical protein
MTLNGQHFDRENNSLGEGEDDDLPLLGQERRITTSHQQRKQTNQLQQLLEFWKETISLTLSSFVVSCLMNQVSLCSPLPPPLSDHSGSGGGSPSPLPITLSWIHIK